MLEIIVKALVSLGEGIMSIFYLGHTVEKHVAKGSVVGESKMDRDTRRWHEKILDTWWFTTLVICLVLSGFGYAIWHHLSR